MSLNEGLDQERSGVSPFRSTTLVTLLEQAAEKCPDHKAYTFVDDKLRERGIVKYAELHEMATVIAHILIQEAGVECGDRVVLVFEPGLEFMVTFWGCILAGAVSVPAAPPSLGSPSMSSVIRSGGGASAQTMNKGGGVAKPDAIAGLTSQMKLFQLQTIDCGAKVVLTSSFLAKSVLARVLRMGLGSMLPHVRWYMVQTGCRTSANQVERAHPPRVVHIETKAQPAGRGSSAEEHPSTDSASHSKRDESAAANYDLSQSTSLPTLTPRHVAALQYTSGSTSSPKGAVLTHKCLVHNILTMALQAGTCEHSVFVGWVPHFHDMGLIASILHTVATRAHFVSMSPLTFLMHPERWLQLMSKYHATDTSAPNFAFDLAARKTDKTTMVSLDLRTLETAVNGAEPVRASTMTSFLNKFAPCGLRPTVFYPHYGLAEHCVFLSGPERPLQRHADGSCDGHVRTKKSHSPTLLHVTRGSLEAGSGTKISIVVAPTPETTTLVGHGWVHESVKLYIVHPDTCRRLPIDHVGEIWVSSASCAQGYWNRPGPSKDTFGAMISDREQDADLEFLRTGDLGLVHDNELFVCGRIKDIFIVRGRNIYPQDLELTAQEASALVRPGCVAAFMLGAGVEDSKSRADRGPGADKEGLRSGASGFVGDVAKHPAAPIPFGSGGTRISPCRSGSGPSEPGRSSPAGHSYIHTTVAPQRRHRRLTSSASTSSTSSVENQEEDVVVVCEVRDATLSRPVLGRIVESIYCSVSSTHSVSLYDIILLPPKSIAKTTSGKIKRFAVREMYQSGRADYIYSMLTRCGSQPAAARPQTEKVGALDRIAMMPVALPASEGQVPSGSQSLPHTTESEAVERGGTPAEGLGGSDPGRTTVTATSEAPIGLEGENPPSPTQNVPLLHEGPSNREIEQWLLTWVISRLRMPLEDEEAALTTPMIELLDSLQMARLAGALELWLGREVPPELIFEYPTIFELSVHLAVLSGGPVFSDGDGDHGGKQDVPEDPNGGVASPGSESLAIADDDLLSQASAKIGDNDTVVNDQLPNEGVSPAANPNVAEEESVDSSHPGDIRAGGERHEASERGSETVPPKEEQQSGDHDFGSAGNSLLRQRRPPLSRPRANSDDSSNSGHWPLGSSPSGTPTQWSEVVTSMQRHWSFLAELLRAGFPGPSIESSGSSDRPDRHTHFAPDTSVFQPASPSVTGLSTAPVLAPVPPWLWPGFNNPALGPAYPWDGGSGDAVAAARGRSRVVHGVRRSHRAQSSPVHAGPAASRKFRAWFPTSVESTTPTEDSGGRVNLGSPRVSIEARASNPTEEEDERDSLPPSPVAHATSSYQSNVGQGREVAGPLRARPSDRSVELPGGNTTVGPTSPTRRGQGKALPTGPSASPLRGSSHGQQQPPAVVARRMAYRMFRRPRRWLFVHTVGQYMLPLSLLFNVLVIIGYIFRSVRL